MNMNTNATVRAQKITNWQMEVFVKTEGNKILTKTGVVLCQGYEDLQNAHPHFPGPQQLDGHSGMPGIPSPLLAAQSVDHEEFL